MMSMTESWREGKLERLRSLNKLREDFRGLLFLLFDYIIIFINQVIAHQIDS